MSMNTVPLRQVPGDSLVHRLWAGSKLLVVLALSLMTWVLPSWPALAVVAVVVVVTAVTAGIPLGAIPRPPWWFWGLIVAGGALNMTFGADALIIYLRAVTLGLVLLASSILVIWTTPMAEIAPAIATLMRPLRVLRLPVDEWAVAIALCLRGLPLLIEELRMLRAAHRLRPSAPARSGHPAAEMGVVDMITAAMSSALRRSSEMAEAITARGGTGRLTAYPSRPGRIDAVVLGIVGAACIVAIVLTIVL
ncbi:energy-coupling factor transporter transmembrane protein EcfT [Gordonia sp. CPCC 206044]|uniref:energy-coupling factor transporter transmembrane component T family protein n=1 Tax=Gordonia sp. CPCC 206044 TaxID=3140793 RepID=UPI003AF3E06F